MGGKLTVVRQEHFRSNPIDSSEGTENPAIVFRVVVPHRHAQVKQQALTNRVGNDSRQHLPAVLIGVTLQEVIQAAVSAYLQLRARPQPSTLRLRDPDRGQDPVEVALKIQGNRRQRDRCHGDEGHCVESLGRPACVSPGRKLCVKVEQRSATSSALEILTLSSVVAIACGSCLW